MNYSIEFTAEEMQIIGIALGNLPYRQVAQLVDKINQQVQSQSKPENNE